MFDELKKKLRQLDQGVRVSIELELDDDGYLDRKCCSEECGAYFKVMFRDWEEIVRDEEVFCPICRHDDKSTEWNTPEQAEYIKQAAVKYLQDEMGKAIRSDTRKFNRSQPRKSFIKMSMSYKPGAKPVPISPVAADVMTQKVTCSECGCRYSSIGAAFFCPFCGHNSVLDTFANSIETVRQTIAALPQLRATLVDAADENVAEDSVRHIVENGHVKIVSSFQRYAEACFARLEQASSFRIRTNLFQNLKESDEIWWSAVGQGYLEVLGEEAYRKLSKFFQQRHVLVHLDGIVDERYLEHSGDTRFDVGQRLKISPESVLELADIVETLGSRLYSAGRDIT